MLMISKYNDKEILRTKKQSILNGNRLNGTQSRLTPCKTYDEFLNGLYKRNPYEPEFIESVKEVMESVWDIIENEPVYQELNIAERLTEPERVVSFRVPWTDDDGFVHVNRGYRVEFNSSLGPYKGGLRFHSSVNQDILKFLGFEQTFKNSLTDLPLGGAKGGSDFSPKGRSDAEVMRFCQSFMTELFRHIGPYRDVPAGDIGVGEREIGYLFGQYKRLKNEFNGVLTGKGTNWGGSYLRPEATGYGLVYFAEEMMKTRVDSIEKKTVSISGSGNVAQFAAEKILQLGGNLQTLSDSDGTLYDPDGIDEEKLFFIKQLKNEYRGRISEYVQKYKKATFLKNEKPWAIPCDIALPCATQNEINNKDAESLIRNGLLCLAEGANKPCRPEAITLLQKHSVLYGPGKASNAGGVAVSGLEMSQNAMFTRWTRDKVDLQLRAIMQNIHKQCVQSGQDDDSQHIDYKKGANRAAFKKVADTMIQHGIV
jgi:glutamate dehydrogenase (NADP+)